MKTKKIALYSALLVTGVSAVMPAAMAADTANTDSKVTGAANSGGVTLFVEDAGFGEMKIGDKFSPIKDKEYVTFNNLSGSDDNWNLEVKETNFEVNEPHMLLNIGVEQKGSPITGETSRVGLFDDSYGETKHAGEINASWGVAPKIGGITHELTWTITPDVEAYKWGTADAKLKDGVLTVKNGEILPGGFFGPTDEVTSVVFGDNVVMPESSNNLFMQFQNLRSISNVEKADFSKVTNAMNMFAGPTYDNFTVNGISFPALEEVDSVFKGIKADNVNITDISFTNNEAYVGGNVFSNIEANEIKIKGITYNEDPDAAGVANGTFNGTFSGIKANKVDLSEFTNQEIDSMDAMLMNMDVDSLDVTGWKTSRVNDFMMIFEGSQFGEVIGYDTWDFSGVNGNAPEIPYK